MAGGSAKICVLFKLDSIIMIMKNKDVFKKIVRVQRFRVQDLVFSHCVSAKQAAVTR